MTHRKIKGGKKNFSIYTAQEFIASITQHIPDKNFQLVGYYGWYSNRIRGDKLKAESALSTEGEAPDEITILDVSNYKPRRIPSPTLRECTPRAFASRHIKKIWEVDPLECPKCHGEMKIISFITEKPVIRKILEHLGLWKETKRGPPNKASPLAEAIVEIKEQEHEPFDDGWPVYEEPYITVN